MKAVLTRIGLVSLVVMLVACSGSSADPSGQTWQLTELRGSSPIEGTSIDMTIEGAEVSGSSGCNTYTGAASVDVDEATMTLGPNFASTRMACDPAVMDQEQDYLLALTEVTSYEIADDTLNLLDDEGSVLAEFE